MEKTLKPQDSEITDIANNHFAISCMSKDADLTFSCILQPLCIYQLYYLGPVSFSLALVSRQESPGYRRPSRTPSHRPSRALAWARTASEQLDCTWTERRWIWCLSRNGELTGQNSPSFLLSLSSEDCMIYYLSPNSKLRMKCYKLWQYSLWPAHTQGVLGPGESGLYISWAITSRQILPLEISLCVPQEKF